MLLIDHPARTLEPDTLNDDVQKAAPMNMPSKILSPAQFLAPR